MEIIGESSASADITHPNLDKINSHSIWHENILGYLSVDVLCSGKNEHIVYRYSVGMGSCILRGASTNIPVNIQPYVPSWHQGTGEGDSTDILNDTSRLGRVSADSPLNDAHGVSQRIDWYTVGGISVNHQLYIGQLSVKSRPIIGRYMGRYIS